MSAGLLLFLALWAALLGRFELRAEPAPFQIWDRYNSVRTATAGVWCLPDRPVLRYAPGTTLAQLRHELVHVADALDGGGCDGSAGPAQPTGPPLWLRLEPLALAYCWALPSEYVACMAEFAPRDYYEWHQTVTSASVLNENHVDVAALK